MQACPGIARAGAALIAALALWLACLSAPVLAEAPERALARVVPDSLVAAPVEGGGLDLSLRLSLPVPYRAFTLAGPPRLVLDFREVAWDGFAVPDLSLLGIGAARWGLYRPGWSRLVLELDAEMRLEGAELDTRNADATARLALRLVPGVATGPGEGAAPDAEAHLWVTPPRARATMPRGRQRGDRQVIVAIDPGHGGIDPGAQYGGHTEAALMLTLALELREALLRSGRYRVVLTRDSDVFVSLPERVSIARAGGADVFLSLHADALPEGRATGTTIYTLSETASDRASERLATEHDRADLLAGVDLGDQDDIIAGVLMSLARAETQPRADRLAKTLVSHIGERVGRMHRRPHLQAGFSVLRAPDIPSVLIEAGFMSDPRDLNDLIDPAWRARLVEGILSALDAWVVEDAAEAGLLRR